MDRAKLEVEYQGDSKRTQKPFTVFTLPESFVNLSCPASGFPPVNFYWLRDGKIIGFAQPGTSSVDSSFSSNKDIYRIFSSYNFKEQLASSILQVRLDALILSGCKF